MRDPRNHLIAAGAVAAVAGGVAVLLAPSSARGGVGAAVLVALAAAGALALLAARREAAARRLRAEVAALRAEADRRAGVVAQLADDTLPKVVARLRDGLSVDEVLADALAQTPLAGPAEQRIVRLAVEEVGRGERMRAAAMAACANAAGRMQALATSMLADLREMEDRHGEEVLGDLLRLDHATAQAGRLADSIAVLTGARSGRRWTRPIVMESILRGAVGRISAFQRVRLHSTSTVAVAGYAAEGVMHALAELMDNATSFSPPSEEVHVYVEEVQAGVVVTIEDGGLVMSPAALRRAERTVSAEQLDLTTLSGTRLGLAVVGVLARRYGLTVSFRPSSRGGTGAIVIIPRQLITQPRPEPPPPLPEPPARPADQPDDDATGSDHAGRGTGGSGPGRPSSEIAGPATPAAGGTRGDAAAAASATAAPASPAPARPLPKRQRGQTLGASGRPLGTGPARAAGTPAGTTAGGTAATGTPTTAGAASTVRPRRSPSAAGARFSAFQQATARLRAASAPSPAGSAPPAGEPSPGGPAGPDGPDGTDAPGASAGPR
ncbi:MAG: sensor histidine kinase [Frankia sp.]|nr:sensor histidine kinase [Frankia sp.]